MGSSFVVHRTESLVAAASAGIAETAQIPSARPLTSASGSVPAARSSGRLS
jgi:hypothetical protein